MPYNVTMFELDITGTNINNKINNEPHTLSDKQHRSIAPINGPFFGSSLVVYDNTTNTLLTRGIDYQIVEIHQEATLKYGVEIANVILVINSNVSSLVRISYQTLGGHYLDNAIAIANLYESVINDTRPIDWNNGVFNKPLEFPPTIHRHLLEDVYGFEPVVDGLERIKSAITLGQTAIVIEIINNLLTKFRCGELNKNLPSKKLVTYDALLSTLSRLKLLSNHAIEVKQCNIMKGSTLCANVKADVPDGTLLPWTLYKPTGNIKLVSPINGTVEINDGIGNIYVYIQSKDGIVDSPMYIGLKNNLNDVDFTAISYELDITEQVSTDTPYSNIFMMDDNYNNFNFSAYEYEEADRLIMMAFLNQSTISVTYAQEAMSQ